MNKSEKTYLVAVETVVARVHGRILDVKLLTRLHHVMAQIEIHQHCVDDGQIDVANVGHLLQLAEHVRLSKLDLLVEKRRTHNPKRKEEKLPSISL